MISEKQFDRNILKAFVDKQIYRCVTNNNYVFAILVSDTRKVKLVNSIIEDCLSNAYKSKVKQYRKSAWESNILFENGSYIKCLGANSSIRGNKYNALIIDSNIDNEAKNCIGYSCIIPYPSVFVRSDESVDVVNERLKKIKQINNKSDVIEINIE